MKPRHPILAILLPVLAAVLFLQAAAARAGDKIQYDIPAQPLASALTQFGVQSKRQLVFDPDTVPARTARVIKGEYTPLEALDLLIDKTGLTYSVDGKNTIIVRRANALPASASAGAPLLAAVGDVARNSGNEAAGARNEEPPAQIAESDRALTVTSSRIRGASPTANVITIDRAEIERNGFTTTEDVIRSLTFNRGTQGSQQRTSISDQRFNSAGYVGVASVDLRGLGNGTTLVLMNGRRLPGSPVTTFELTDISSIPLSAVERVEIMTDGASSIYGSDAVGGVINFIMRKDYSGGEARLRYNNSSNGADGYDAELTQGLSWQGGSLLATLSAGAEDPVPTSELVSSMDFRGRGGRDLRPVGIGPVGTFFLTNPALAPLLGLPAGTAAVTFPVGVTPSLANAIVSTSGSGANLPRVNFLGPLELTPETERYSLSVTGEHALGSRLTLVGDVLYSRRDAATSTSAYQFSRAAYTPAAGTLLAPVSSATAPFPLLVNYSGINDFLATGSTDALGTRRNDTARYQANAGIKMKFGSDWQAALNLTFGEEQQSSISHDQAITSMPAGFNPFSNGSNQNAAAVASLFGDSTADFNSILRALALTADGGIARIGGGEMRLSAGLEVREEVFGVKNQTGFGGRRDLQALYAEINAPLVGGANARAGVRSLIFTAAGRYERYDQEGIVVDSRNGNVGTTAADGLDAFSPSLGLAWMPVEAVTMRANWSRSFNIPLITQLVSSNVSFAFPLPDPTSSTGFTTTEILIRGNPALKEQTGETASLGLEWSPAATPGAKLSLLYNRIEIQDLIGNLLQFSTDFTQLLAIGNTIIPGSVTRNPNGTATMDLGPINFARQLSEGVDVRLGYRFNADSGSWNSDVVATRTFHHELFTGTGGTGNRAGAINGPAHWKVRGSLSWDAPVWSATAALNYESGYRNTNANVILRPVGSYATVDAQLSREIGGWMKGARLALGASNLFDAEFPFVDNSFGFEGTRVDFRGRRLYLDMKLRF